MIKGHTTASESYGDQTAANQSNLFMRNSQHSRTVRSPLKQTNEDLHSDLNSSGLNNSSSNLKSAQRGKQTPTPSRLSMKQKSTNSPSRKKDVSWAKSPSASNRKPSKSG